MLGIVTDFFAAIMSGLKQPMESFITLETSDDAETLAAPDGSLISYVRIGGTRRMIGDAEYQQIIVEATLKLGARFDRSGYAMQFYFSRDPDRIKQDMVHYMAPSRTAAKSAGLDLSDLLNERARHLAKYMASEEIYLALWTRPSALAATEASKAIKERTKKKWAAAPRAQFPYAALDGLSVRHKSYVSAVTTSLDELGIVAKVMEVHEGLLAVRNSIYPDRRSEVWRPCLPGDPIPARQTLGKPDASDILWPPLRQQLCIEDAKVVGPSAVRIGNYLWSGVEMTLAPVDPSPFPLLLNRLIDSDMPFRISFLIESDGIASTGMKKFISSVMGFSNDTNKRIKLSLESLQQLAQSEPVVRLRITLATYAPLGQHRLLETRLANMTQAIESWGYCQVSQLSGDPLQCVMSSAFGIACASSAPAAVAPFTEVIKMLPWQRACSPFPNGAILLRTPDGRPWPYQTGTSLTTTWFDLIFAQPGAGKSVLMNAINLGVCLTAGVSRLPFIAILDIGPSSSGLISLLKDALPLDRRHEAQHFKLRMTPEYSVNPFDTQLGCRYALADERSYLCELLTLLCTPAGQDQPYDGIPQLVGLCVDEMYRWRDDSAANAEPRPFLSGIEEVVDQAIAKLNIHLPTEPYWWDVVDELFERGQIHAATIAQRQATPTLVDAVTAARRPQIRALLEETQIGASAEGVIHAFERMIASAIREFPILSGVTKFDIGASRVCAIDLGEVAPQGDEIADRQTAIMYMLARHVMVRSWWLNQDALRTMPARYRTYHEQRIREIREMPKRISYDEFHRTSRTRSVRAQVVRDVREGRKWGVQIVLASQLLEDFSDDIIDLASGIWICGATVSERSVQIAGDRFGLSETARMVMRYRLTGPRASGAPVLFILGTNEGRYEHHLINTLGPIELWALSTSAEDVEVRTRLYAKVGAVSARRLLAGAYPGGSARQEIRRRIVMRTEKGESETTSTSMIIEEIVAELAEILRREINETMRQPTN